MSKLAQLVSRARAMRKFGKRKGFDLAVAHGSNDLAIVPAGGWGARLSAGHMGPQQAAVACRLTAARCAIPVHWKTLHLPGAQSWPRGWMDSGGAEFAAALAGESPTCRAVVLDVGESVRLPDFT